nr:hypothetical protein [Tanacetum cinerariifolium]
MSVRDFDSWDFEVGAHGRSGRGVGTVWVEHKDTKKSNEMYYPRFTKVIIHYFMSKDPSIPRRKKANWHYVRDDHMFSTIKLVSRHQNTQQFGALLPIELTNEDIRNSNAYKEYYAVAIGVTPPKPKASVWKTRSSSDTTITPPTAIVGPRLTTSEKGKQAAKASKAKSLSALSEELVLYQGKDGDGDDEGNNGDDGEEGDDDDDDDDDEQDDDEAQDDDDKGNDLDDEEEGSVDEQASDEEEFIHPSLSTHDEEETRDEERMESIFETTSQMDVQTLISVAPLPMSAPTLTPSTIATITTTKQAPLPPTIALSTLLQDLPNFGSLFGFDHRLKTLEANFSEFSQTNQFARAVSAIPEIVQRYMDQRMNEAVKVTVHIESDRLRNEAQADNDKFLKTIDENMQKIINEQVKKQVKVQLSKILPKIEQIVNEQLEAEVLTRSSNSSNTSYAIAADLSGMELKKILIEKMKGNKSIQRSNKQRNLYKALVEAYKSDKIILDTYGDTVTLKRRRDDDADRDEEPSAGSDRGSKRRREGNEPESASALTEKATRKEPMQTTFEMEEPSHPEFETSADDQPIVQSSQHPEWFSQQQKPPTPDRDWNKTLPAIHRSIQLWISKLVKQSDSRSSNVSAQKLEYQLEEVYKATTDQLDWVNPEGQQYPHNLLKPLPLIPKNRGRRVIPFDYFINNYLEYLRGGASSRKCTTAVTKTMVVDYGHIKWIKDLVPRTLWIQEPIGYDKHAL